MFKRLAVDIDVTGGPVELEPDKNTLLLSS
jgi:hypothetical protein